MAIVKEFTTKSGTQVFVHDDAYAGCSQAELDRRIRLMQRTAWRCAARAAERRTGEPNEEGDTKDAETIPLPPVLGGGDRGAEGRDVGT